MNNDKALSKKSLSIILLILLILALLSAAVLASRLGNLNKKNDDENTIPIGDDAKIEEGEGGGEGEPEIPEMAELQITRDYDIFRVSYTNDEGKITVKSENGEKVVAPGTNWNFNFSVFNPNKLSLDYEMYLSVTIKGPEIDLPLLMRLRGPENKWVTEQNGAFIPMKNMELVKDVGVLAGGNSVKYRFSWKWPFESGSEEADAFDTMLGNLEMKEDIDVIVKIWIYAWTDEIPDKPGGDPPSPGTGDDFNVGVWVTMLIISLFGFVAVLAREKREPLPIPAVLPGDSDRNGKNQE